MPPKKAFVFQVNLARRNISPEYKRNLLKVMKGVAAELKAEGKTQRQIGVMLGVARETVRDWLTPKDMHNGETAKTHNSHPDARTKVSAAAKPVIVERLEAGESQEQVAVDIGVAQSQISRIAKAEEKRKIQKNKWEKAAKLSAASTGIHVGKFQSFASVGDATAKLILTDPPYDEGSVEAADRSDARGGTRDGAKLADTERYAQWPKGQSA